MSGRGLLDRVRDAFGDLLRGLGLVKSHLKVRLAAPTTTVTGVAGAGAVGSTSAAGVNGTVTYWAPTLATNDLTEQSGGWKFASPEGNFNVSVVDGFSKDGATGKSVRFLFNGTLRGDGTTQSQSQLAFTVGTAGITTLWTEFYLYYPAGGEVVGGVTLPAWQRSSGINSANNNKFFALYKHYTNTQGDALRRVFETWMPHGNTLLEGQIIGGWRNQCDAVFSHDWSGGDYVYSFERTDKLGIWRRIQIGHVMESASLAADGHMEVWIGDNGAAPTLAFQKTGYTEICSTGAGTNQWNYGYLQGYQNAATLGTQYLLMSNLRFTNLRPTD